MTQELAVLLDGREAGRVRRDRSGRLTFTYAEAWRRSPSAYPLSLSMPLTASTHGHARIDAFLWGLLPDNRIILDGWARRLHASARNAFSLIACVGEDCAGAVQLVRPERLDTLAASSTPSIEWIDEKGVAARLRALRRDASAWRIASDAGQFSLAGAQAKTALLLRDGRWGVPSGRVPTTHILKPPLAEFEGHVENEHFCLDLAADLGLPAAESRVMRFDDETAIVVTRYDRVRTGRVLVRVHQEDTCQALGIPPGKKYEVEGGPGAVKIVALLREHSTARDEDVATFVDAFALNWLIAGTDAHAKNYSLLIAPGRVRLAPLYDLASALPYASVRREKLRLAMRVGGEYRLRDVGIRQWNKLSTATGLPPEVVIQRVRRLADALPDAAAQVRRRATAAGLDRRIVGRLADELAARAKACQALLA